MENLKTLKSEDFRNYLNQAFKLELHEVGVIELSLVQVEELILTPRRGAKAPDVSGREQFSLVFHGPAEPLLPQSIYSLNHPEMGQLDIFLVPLGPEDDGLRYEAVFT